MGGEKRQKISYITRKISLHIFCDHEISTCESRRGKKGHQNLRWGGSTTGGPSTTRSLRSIDHSQKRQKKKKKPKKGIKISGGGARTLGGPCTTRSLGPSVNVIICFLAGSGRDGVAEHSFDL